MLGTRTFATVRSLPGGSRGGTQSSTPPPPVRTNYLQLGGQTIAQIANGNPTYLHADLIGSPRKATNAAGGVLWQEHYDPFGKKLNGVATKIGYTGHAYDAESGYTYAQARFYDPLVGRFLSTDPIYFQDENPFTFNRFAYANNNPYRFTDPTGLTPQDAIDRQVRKGGTIGENDGCQTTIACLVSLNGDSQSGKTKSNDTSTNTGNDAGPAGWSEISIKLGDYFKAKISADGSYGLSASTDRISISLDSNGNSTGQLGTVSFDTSDFGNTLNSLGLNAENASASLYNFSPGNVDFKVTASLEYKILGFNIGNIVGPITFSGNFNPNPINATLGSSGLLGIGARAISGRSGVIESSVNPQ